MNKLIPITILFIISAISNAAVAVLAANTAAMNLANQQDDQQQMNQQHQMRVNTSSPHNNIIGAMTCHAAHNNIPGRDAWDYFGCKNPTGTITIQEFFMRHRRSPSYEIKQIIFNENGEWFVIYYGEKQLKLNNNARLNKLEDQ